MVIAANSAAMTAALSKSNAKERINQYKHIVLNGEKESPQAERNLNKKGKTAQINSRNSLVHLRDPENDVSENEALEMLFDGKLPNFIQEKIDSG